MTDTRIRLLDTHCHLDLYPDYAAVLSEVEHAGIYTIAVTNTPSVFPKCANLTRDTRFVRPAIGLHPELAVARQHELPLLIELLPQTRYVGEVGLDYVTRDPTMRAIQRHVFGTLLEYCAASGDKVLTVHSRRAAAEVVAMVGNAFPGTIILHWFSGPLSILNRALAQGCYFSINPKMITSASGQRIVAALPPERVLTETDGPFVSVSGRPARPPDIVSVISYLAELWKLDIFAAAQRVQNNFRHAITLQ